MHELILYATPTGPLADAVGELFAWSTAPPIIATTAQTYPPHVTLTGFFHRTAARAVEIERGTAAWCAATGPVPADAVRVTELRNTTEWCGLVIESPWLLDATATWMRGQRVAPDEDALRPKDWLHLSLAYGDGPVAEVAGAAVASIDPELPARWELGLWERDTDGGWRRRV